MERDLKREARVVAKLYLLLPEGPLKKKIGLIKPGSKIGPELIQAAREVLINQEVSEFLTDYFRKYGGR